MNIQALKFLHSSEGKELLKEYSGMSSKELKSLGFTLKKKDIPYAPEMITLLDLRLKARDKFSRAEQMFFTRDNLQQASDEKIAKYISQRFVSALPSNSKISDLTCGAGINTIFLAEHFSVRAVDHDEINLACAEYNAEAYDAAKNIEFIPGEAENNIIASEAFFIDPQRIREGDTKTRSLGNAAPDIFSLLPQMLEMTSNICIKISPAFDYSELDKLPLSPEVEIISEDKTNKAALLWFGKFKTCERRATILTEQKGSSFSFTESSDPPDIPVNSSPLSYIYEPNKAITKARLINEVAAQYDLKKLNPHLAFLTSDHPLPNAQNVFRRFKVLEVHPFSLKSLKQTLKKEGIDRAHIMVRRFPQNPEEMRSQLKLKEGGRYTIILTVLSDEKRYFIIAEEEHQG